MCCYPSCPLWSALLSLLCTQTPFGLLCHGRHLQLLSAQPFQEPHPQEKWRCWIALICFQIGIKLTSILSRKPQRTKNMHSVSTTQAPVVEHQSETDWLTAALGMAQARDETWWHRDVLVGFVPPTAEVSLCGTFLLEIRHWKELVYKQWEWLGCCPPGTLVSCVGPLAEWWSTNTDHQHKTRWQSADTGAQISAWPVKPLIYLCDRSSCCLHQTGGALWVPQAAADLFSLQHNGAQADFFLLPLWNLLDAGVWA